MAFAQKKPSKEKAKDTIKTEVITVTTSYNPTISDAFKIKKNPAIKLSKRSEKKKLQYHIFSAPVASTFIPKSGAVKGLNLGRKERLYNNYLALGFGNNTTPFLEAFIHHSTRFENDFGIYAKYISSANAIGSTPLNSNFSNIKTSVYYKQEERYFDWKVEANFDRQQYNWYGLPTTVRPTAAVLNNINEEQVYTYADMIGSIDFEDAYLNSGTLQVSYFKDRLNSKEIAVALQPKFKFPLQSLGRNFNDLQLNVNLEYLGGEFAKTYGSNLALKYSLFTISAHPVYQFTYKKFDIKAGAKLYFSSDSENSISQFLAYPDVHVSYPVVANYANVYIGAGGDLHTNSYQKFVAENPYVSPNLFITQTHEKFNFYGGANGKLAQNVSYDIKASYKQEEDKPLFIRNNSKSNGSTSTSGGANLLGYEYGNSFNVVYDDVKTLTFFGEVEVDVSKELVVGANGTFNSFTMTNQAEAWNLPKLSATVFAKYKREKWYAGASMFIVDERLDLVYNGLFPSNPNAIQRLDSYIDLNLNGGYHFNDKFSAFLKLNNVLNNQYQRFANFTVQGFQVLGGATYKFDF